MPVQGAAPMDIASPFAPVATAVGDVEHVTDDAVEFREVTRGEGERLDDVDDSSPAPVIPVSDTPLRSFVSVVHSSSFD